MVKAEISYNPYLLETVIKFNGQKPKINSLVERYHDARLQSWISKIPEIFYNEMNGYNFDLDFSGTKADYNDLIGAFNHTNVRTTETQKSNGEIVQADVRLFFKNELEDSQTKSQEIARLLNWFKQTPNRKFDEKHFREKYTELFDQPYTYLLISAENIDTSVFDESEISVEKVSSIAEIPNDLKYTPILFFIDEGNQTFFFDIVNIIVNREDVSGEQLFFLVAPKISAAKLERDIQDKGIRNPQIIDSIDDDRVIKFLEIYPIADYVYKAINIFRAEIHSLDTLIQGENDTARIYNREVYSKLNDLDFKITKLRSVNEQFIQKDNLEIESLLSNEKHMLNQKIQNWRKKKTKYSNDRDALNGTLDFQKDLERYFEEFQISLISFVEKEVNRVIEDSRLLYDSSDASDNFYPISVMASDIFDYELPNLREDLLSFRDVKMVEPADDFLSFAKKLMREQPKLLVEETTYSINDWRAKASEKLLPIADEVCRKIVVALNDYYERIYSDYHLHLEELLSKKIVEKERIATKLSQEEQRLQIDNDWLATFKEQLKRIERG